MCNFFSALALRNGDLRWHSMLDSHSDLVRYFKLPDASLTHQHFAKIELTPVDWMDPATWTFRLDEDAAPVWWPDVSERVEKTAREIVSRMILKTGEHELIVDGCWIIGGDAKVRDIRSGRILRVQDTARLETVGGSAQVHGVRGSAQVHGVWGSAQVRGVGDSAQVHDVGDSAQVHGVRGSAQVHGVWGSAQVRGVGDSAQVRGVGPNVVLDASAKAHLVTP